jgi:hypothetical protein
MQYLLGLFTKASENVALSLSERTQYSLLNAYGNLKISMNYFKFLWFNICSILH